MARRLSVGFNWQGPFDWEQGIARVRAADDAGADTVWVPEAWGRDCFTMLAVLGPRDQAHHAWAAASSTPTRAPRRPWRSISPPSTS